MKPILEIQNIGKKYRIQHLAGGYLSLRERMANALKFERNTAEDFWALKNVSFEVQPGESIGIIGRNGAGKSTLLKILSKITPPTSGKIVSRGRIASLLEVGTGFHPELTGRENIFFNGSLLGMKLIEITAKFDEIVDFSGVEKFLDTPLKHFSSGMQLRLAFAVAAFLEPEILIIDEVLAVGDAEFQRKAMGKMKSVSTEQGRTVLFVSHSMDAVTRLCTKAVILKRGQVQSLGRTEEVVNQYLRGDYGTTACKKWDENGNVNVSVNLIELYAHNQDMMLTEVFDLTEPVGITVRYRVSQRGLKLAAALNFYTANGYNIFDSHQVPRELNQEKEVGVYESTVWISPNLFAEGTIVIGVAIVTHNPFLIHLHEKDAIALTMVDKSENNPTRGDYAGQMAGLMRPLLQWNLKRLE
jgi:lipopolysaccharide transport system ATP-binding protein